MDALRQDLVYAFRNLRKSPGYAAVTVLTLALGIGANSAIFSVVNGVLLKPLPYPQPERLVFITSQFPTLGFNQFWVSAPEFLEFRERNKAFAEVGAYRSGAVNLGTEDQPRRVNSAVVTSELMPVLGVAPIRGSQFTREDTLPGAEDVAILSSEIWQTAFSSDESVLGRVVRIDGAPRRIVGIMPTGYDVHDSKVQIWLPLTLDPAAPGQSRRSLPLPGRTPARRRDAGAGGRRRRAPAGAVAGAQSENARAEHEGPSHPARWAAGRSRRRHRDGAVGTPGRSRLSCCSSRAQTSRTCCSRAPSPDRRSLRFGRRSAPGVSGCCASSSPKACSCPCSAARSASHWASRGLRAMLAANPDSMPAFRRRRPRSPRPPVHAGRFDRHRPAVRHGAAASAPAESRHRVVEGSRAAVDGGLGARSSSQRPGDGGGRARRRPGHRRRPVACGASGTCCRWTPASIAAGW